MAYVRSYLVGFISHIISIVMIIRSLIVWILLIALILASFLFSETPIGRFSVIALMATVIVKCYLVGFHFMELNKAHAFWRIAFLSIIGIFMVIVSVVVLVGGS